MVHPVVTGGVEDILKWSDTFHNLSVDPELVQQIELFVNNSMAWRDEESHRKIERLQ